MYPDRFIIAGAGGIAEAAALLLAEWSPKPVSIFIGNRTLAKAEQVAAWVQSGVSKACDITSFHLPETGLNAEAENVFKKGGVLLDCLPGSQAPPLRSNTRNRSLGVEAAVVQDPFHAICAGRNQFFNGPPQQELP